VNDFVPHINGRSMLLQRKFNDLYRAIDAGAKSAWSSEKYRHFGFGRIWFSHGQCHIGNDAAKAKDFHSRRKERCRDGNRPIKEP
jgi:hypothetical protein